MAFEQSILFVLQSEGGYCNWKNDRGGETYKGVARNKWPQWAGWQFIDEAKQQMDPGTNRRSWAAFTQFVEQNYPDLDGFVQLFYKQNFWDPQHCDYFHEAISHLIFDFGVNSGSSRAGKHLQKSINACGIQCGVDGAIGQGTIDACSQADPSCVCQAMLQDREAFYRALAAKDPTQIENLNGWLNRVAENSNFITQFLG